MKKVCSLFLSLKSMNIVFIAGVLLRGPCSFASNYEDLPSGDLTVKFAISNPSLTTTLLPPSGDSSKELVYQPEPAYYTGVTIDYAGLGIGIAGKNPDSTQQDNTYGTTTVTDFQLRLYGKKVSYELYYQNYRGYYLQNTSSALPESSGYYLQPEMTSEALGFNVLYNTAPNDFSLNAQFDQTALPTHSGGAWFAIGSANRHRLSNPNGFIVGQNSFAFGDFNGLTSTTVYTLSAGFGGAYALVFRNFHLGGMLTLSPSVADEYVTINNADSTGLVSSLRFSGKAVLGYANESFFAGIRGLIDNNNIPIKGTTVQIVTNEIQVYLGFHFHNMHMHWLEGLVGSNGN